MDWISVTKKLPKTPTVLEPGSHFLIDDLVKPRFLGLGILKTRPSGPAYGKLKRGDQIISVNGKSIEEYSREEATSLLKSCTETVTLFIQWKWNGLTTWSWIVLFHLLGRDREISTLSLAIIQLNGTITLTVHVFNLMNFLRRRIFCSHLKNERLNGIRTLRVRNRLFKLNVSKDRVTCRTTWSIQMTAKFDLIGCCILLI
jgi:hypothetical protein